VFLTEDVSALIRRSNRFIRPTFQYLMIASNEDRYLPPGGVQDTHRKKAPSKWGLGHFIVLLP
jgi:hypothetical protein